MTGGDNIKYYVDDLICIDKCIYDLHRTHKQLHLGQVFPFYPILL